MCDDAGATDGTQRRRTYRAVLEAPNKSRFISVLFRFYFTSKRPISLAYACTATCHGRQRSASAVTAFTSLLNELQLPNAIAASLEAPYC